MISELKGENRFLSNFFSVPIRYEGIEYPSVEHAFQAAKTLNQEERIKFTTNKNPVMAKRMGKKVQLRADWERVKVGIMRELVMLKFSQEPLKGMLLATGNVQLEEGNRWHDRFWGVCPPRSGRGENMLGKLLMEARDKLKGEN